MCYVADSIYPPQLCLEPYDIVTDIWIRYMFVDEACESPFIAQMQGLLLIAFVQTTIALLLFLKRVLVS